MNKKKKKNLIISCLLLVLLVGFNGLMIVSGAEVWHSAKPGITGGGGGSVASGWVYNVYGMGVRIAWVDKNGTPLAEPYDIMAANALTSLGMGNSDVLTLGGTTSHRIRKDVTDGVFSSVGKRGPSKSKASESPGFTAAVSGGGAGKFITGSETEWWLKSADHLFGITGSGCSAVPIKDTASYVVKLADHLKNSTDLKKDLDAFLSAIGVSETYDQLMKDNDGSGEIDLKERYIQIEPTIVASRSHKIGEDSYESYQPAYGSVTEMAFSYNDGTYPMFKAVQGTCSGIGVYVDSLEHVPSSITTPGVGGGTAEHIVSNLNMGEGVGIIWMGEFTSSNNCEYILEEVIHKNPSKYPVDSDAYHTAIEAIRKGPSYIDSNTGEQYQFEDASGNKYTIDTAYNDDHENFWLIKENYVQREKMGKKAQCIIHEADCKSAVNFLNNNWHETAKVGTAEYDSAILKIIDGSWFYYADNPIEDYWLIDQAYPVTSYQGLDKSNYGDGKASCDGEVVTCSDALEIIHLHPDEFGSPGSSQYDDAIATIRNGSFKYEEKDASGNVIKIIKLDQPWTYNMLLKANYGNGEADCKNVDLTTCGVPVLKRLDKDCESGYNYYKDSSIKKYWLECETAYTDGGKHTSDNTGHIAVEDTNDGIVGNSEYCKLFCYEEVETSFPIKVTGVKAGQTFGWGKTGFRESDVYGTVKVHKYCSNQERTDSEGAAGKGYLYKKWENDYKDNEKKLIEGYIRKGAAEEAKDHISVTTGSCCYLDGCHNSDGDPVCCIYGYQSTAKASQNHTNPGEASGNWPNATTQSASTSKTSSCYLDSSSAYNEAYNAAKSDLEGQASSANSAYVSAANEEPKLLKKIRQCTNNIKYEYKTVVDFVFKEPVNSAYGANDRTGYDYNKTLIKDPEGEDEGYNQTNVNKSTCTEKTVYSYDCSGSKLGSKCTSSEEKVLDCKQVTWDITGEWTYKYPAEQFTWFSLKTNNHLVNQEHKADEGAEDVYFYSLGFGLPTAFTLPSGVYDMSVIVTNLGDNADITDAVGADYNKPDGHFGPVLDSTAKGKGFEYKCTYEVDNDIFGYDCVYEGGVLTPDSPVYCDKSKDKNPNGELVGIDVAYRLVGLLKDGDDINKAFPGQDGAGRRIGSNWNLDDDVIKDILRDDIYSQDRNGQPNLAMYEIFLDVGTIQEIRKDNKNFAGSGDAYTSFENVKCAGDGNTKYCASDFVSDLASGRYGQRLYGTCLTVSDTQGRADDVLANGCNGSYTFPAINWVR